MKRFSPRDLTLYLLVIVLMLFAVTSLQQMNQADGPTYSDIRALFVQEKVSYFELEDNTLTLTLREEDGKTSTVTYQVARPDWLYQDLHQLWEDQMEAGLLRYDLPPGVESSWWYNYLPYLIGLALVGFFMYLMYRQRAAMGGGGGGAPGASRFGHARTRTLADQGKKVTFHGKLMRVRSDAASRSTSNFTSWCICRNEAGVLSPMRPSIVL